MDFYIPYIFVFFMLFGGPSKLFGDTKKNIDENHFELEQFSDVVRPLLCGYFSCIAHSPISGYSQKEKLPTLKVGVCKSVNKFHC